jgi:colanic acid biosynthesis glycosyl transferase WcaI
MYKYLRRKPMFFHVKDLQVDAAKQLNIIRNKALLSILEKVEKFFLKNATLVTTLTPGMRKKMIHKGIDADHVKLFPDWVDTSFMRPMYEERLVLKEKYGFQAWQHVVLYAGNIGEKQGLDGVIDVATKLQSQERNDIQFMIVGEGAAKEKLVQKAKDRRLRNVKFSTLVPAKELPVLLNMADLHLVLQKKGATDLVMPSKLLGILPCGGIPLVAAEKGSGLRELIETHNIGITTEPEDTEALLRSILRFFEEPDLTLARNARQYAVHHWAKDIILEDFESLMYQVVDEHKATVLASVEYP